MTSPKSLIINSPYDPPLRHWQQARDGTLALVEKRRPAGYEIFDIRNNTRRTEPLDRVSEIRTRDDALPNAHTMRSKLYHIYREAEVAEDLNRRAEAHEALPKLVQDAYTLLGADWRETLNDWRKAGHASPPVMLTVCNRTETSARVEHYFRSGDAHWPELHAPARTLRVDSKVLEKAELGEAAGADKNYEAERAARGYRREAGADGGLGRGVSTGADTGHHPATQYGVGGLISDQVRDARSI